MGQSQLGHVEFGHVGHRLHLIYLSRGLPPVPRGPHGHGAAPDLQDVRHACIGQGANGIPEPIPALPRAD